MAPLSARLSDAFSLKGGRRGNLQQVAKRGRNVRGAETLLAREYIPQKHFVNPTFLLLQAIFPDGAKRELRRGRHHDRRHAGGGGATRAAQAGRQDHRLIAARTPEGRGSGRRGVATKRPSAQAAPIQGGGRGSGGRRRPHAGSGIKVSVLQDIFLQS